MIGEILLTASGLVLMAPLALRAGRIWRWVVHQVDRALLGQKAIDHGRRCKRAALDAAKRADEQRVRDLRLWISAWQETYDRVLADTIDLLDERPDVPHIAESYPVINSAADRVLELERANRNEHGFTVQGISEEVREADIDAAALLGFRSACDHKSLIHVEAVGFEPMYVCTRCGETVTSRPDALDHEDLAQ